jgi:hypothetical protein
METVFLALRRAAQDLVTPRMLSLVLWPMGIALLLWGGLAWWFGAAWKAELEALLAATPLQSLAEWAGADWLLAYAALFVLVLLWLPAMYATALLITSVALMPFIVAHVAERHYPALERRRGGSLAGSLGNGLVALLVYLPAWLLLLPVWLFAPFGVLVSVLLNAWLNQRLFMYDALSEHAGPDELRGLRHAGGLGLFGMAALLGLLHLVPLLNLLAPVYMGLAFAHYALDAVARSRRGSMA